jgi:hypothetical protein
MATPEAKVKITADNKTQKGINEAKSSFKGLSKNLKALGIAGAAAGVAVGTGLTLIVKSSLDAQDAIGKLAKTYGIATKELAAFKLQAELGGSSLNTFVKASRQVSKNVFDFVVRGAGEAVDAFKALGITTAQLTPIMNDNTKVMAFIGERLNAMQDGSVKTAVAFKLLGGRSLELLPALRGGSEELARITKETERFGNALDEAAIQRSEDAKDAITLLFSAYQGFRDQLVSKLAPALTLVAEKMKEMHARTLEAKGGIDEYTDVIAVRAIGAMETLTISVAMAINVYRELQTEFNNFVNWWKDNSFVYDLFRLALDKVAEGWSLLADLARDASGNLVTSGTVVRINIDEIREGFDKLRASLNEVEDAADDAGGKRGLQGFTKAQEEAAAEAAKLNAELERQAQVIFDSTRTAAEQYAITLERLNVLLDKGKLSHNTYTRAVIQAQDAMQDLLDKNNEADKHFKQLQSTIEGWSRSFADNMLSAEASFSGFVTSLLEEMARIAIARSTQPFFDAFADLVTGFLPSFSGASATAATAAATGGILPLASGTDYVPRDGLAMLHRGEAVVPATGRGGGSVIVNIINQGAEVTQSERRGADDTRIIDIEVKNSLNRLSGAGALSKTVVNPQRPPLRG